jgi:hypothetical protein
VRHQELERETESRWRGGVTVDKELYSSDNRGGGPRPQGADSRKSYDFVDRHERDGCVISGVPLPAHELTVLYRRRAKWLATQLKDPETGPAADWLSERTPAPGTE